MKKDRWIRIFAAVLIAVATVAVTTVEVEAQAQKFKLRDLFKKKAAAANKAKAEKAKAAEEKLAETEATEKPTEKAEPEMEKVESAKSAEKTVVKTSASGGAAKVVPSKKSTTSQLKELSTSDKLKSLTGKLDKAGSDPDVLLQSARERFRAMKAKESSSKKEPVAVARSSATEKKGATTTAVPKTQKVAEVPATEAVKKKEMPTSKQAIGKTQPSPVATAVNAAEKPVTGGGTASVAKATNPSRPPSLTSVAAVAAAPKVAVSEVEAPPENLQLSLAASNVPPPRALVSKKKKKEKAASGNVMEIISDEVEMDNAKRTTTFIGNVDLKHPTFFLKSDRLLIYMNEEDGATEGKQNNDESGAPPFKEAVATGARVIVERLNADGKKDVGQARKVVYDARTGDLVLSGGPPQLQSGKSLVKTNSEDATIILKKDGNHKVVDRGSKGGTKVIIPVKNEKKGKPTKQPTLIPTKLGDISKRK